MTHSSRWLLGLGIRVMVCGAAIALFAQDDVDALLRDLGGQPQPAVVAPPQPAAPVPAPAAIEAAPAVVAPAVEGAGEDYDSLISELLTLETIRRRSLDDHGNASLATARQALRDGDFPLARTHYQQAIDFIGNRPATLAARQEAESGMAEAYYQEARQAMRRGQIDHALPLAARAHERGHPQGARLLEALKREPARADADVSSIAHRVNEEERKENRDEIRRRLRRARQFFTTAEYDKALEECELILRDHPGEVEAMQLRDRIADRRKEVADIEFEATRSLMISDVRKAWTPDRYAIESAQTPQGRAEATARQPVSQISATQTAEQVVARKLREIIIPEVTFRPPATIIDAVDFFKQASIDYDNPEIPVQQRGVNFVLRLASAAAPAPAQPAAFDPFAPAAPAAAAAANVPVISALSARFISLFDALKLVCDVTGMKFRIRGNIVMIVPFGDPDDELVTRSYNVLPAFQERMAAASVDMGDGGAGAAAGAGSPFMTPTDMSQRQDWKDFFAQMGVQWPDGSAISYMSAIGKLRVTNTAEQLAVFEQVLEDLNVTPRLIEIEARFVEVSQEDLNSLGFEWLLNSDFSFNAGGFLSRSLGLKEFSNAAAQLTDGAGNLLYAADGVTPLLGFAPHTRPGGVSGTGYRFNADGTLSPVAIGSGQAGMVPAPRHNVGIGAIDGQNYSTGQRYLSTMGNPIAGEGNQINDQFMRVNAFLGNADISMILHMLSQRSDTDLLSAPKVVTKSGQEAVMKVVTEYIYPTEFQVQISQQGTTGGGIGGGGSGEPLAMVEPQNFEMREVGVILQVVPEVSAEGQMINLMLNPQVVSEPVWKNYGTRVPRTRPGFLDTVTGIFSPPTVEYTELPMEQPFFHVRSVMTQLSIYNGATVVMGGLINEQRKTMEDKIPFLGDLPYLGRLFRSRSEQSEKRNLLIFVTARLVDPAGRLVRTSLGEPPIMAEPESVAPVLPP